ncbi:MAG: hypothetical protein QXH07_07415 [Thermoplasmata archaeon]
MPIYPSTSTAIDDYTIQTNAQGQLVVNVGNIVDNLTLQQNSSSQAYAPSLIPQNLTTLQALEGPNAQNLYFSSDTAGANKLNSWLESGYSNAPGTTHSWWVNLGSLTIPANSSITIYLQIAPQNTNVYNTTTTGVAPQLTSSYAQYDNGTQVFTKYWNFAGTSLPSGWVGSGVTVNNGISFPYSSYANDNGSYLNPGNILEFYGEFQGANSTNGNVVGYIGSSSTLPTPALGFTITNASYSWGPLYGITSTSSADSTTSAWGNATSNELFAIYWASATSATVFLPGYGSNYSTTFTSNIPTTALPIGGANTQGSQTTLGPFYYFRVREYPPNGVMPSVSLGMVKNGGASNYLAITLTNNQSTATPTNFQMNIQINNNANVNYVMNSAKQNLNTQTTTSTSPVIIDTINVYSNKSATLGIEAIVYGSNNTVGDGITVGIANGSTTLVSETYTQEGAASNPNTFVLFAPLNIAANSTATINLTFNAVTGGTASAQEILFKVSEV